MIKDEINYEKENEKLILFLKKQAERIAKLKKRCNKNNTNGKKEEQNGK